MTVVPKGGNAAASADSDDAQAATTRSAKGSVQEAIGKLIGDDEAQRRGAAEKQAGEIQASGQQAREERPGPK